ncbi:biotin synthase [Desulfonatronum thiosulfatophilum]|uniref:Biotin synthase n=1 Tax=Desulfonatronum thiosulfatophilum TaxID=617002 RepID=A0A1G6ANT8_9BACT|nr:biotin synthase BioB [Desulfonatronum thiosulfatophilum]SDB10058.1 biotin synthase [Desulfonatronum thiosulfatophilum]
MRNMRTDIFFEHAAEQAAQRGLYRVELHELAQAGFVRTGLEAGFLKAAHALKEAAFPGQIHVCAITSAKTGRCGEDCAFCAQSARFYTDLTPHPLLSEDELVRRGEEALASGISRFGLVASGGRLSPKEIVVVCHAAQRLTQAGIVVDVSPGMLNQEEFKQLREAGIGCIHHNLETSAGFYPRICTSHSWKQRAKVVQAATEAGCSVCSGGIFGMGESWADRVDLALCLRELGVHSVPLNFLNPIAGTPLAHYPVLAAEEALAIIALFRFALPTAHIRIAGGRQRVFGNALQDIFASGASGVMVGDYLTTPGMSMKNFKAAAQSYGLRLV